MGMNTSAALMAGLATGFAIAVQVGVVSLLVVETAALRGTRAGLAAGMGVASADLAFAAVAAAAGGAASEALAAHEAQIRLVAAACLAAIALHGLVALRRDGPPARGAADGQPGAGRGGVYLRFVAVTAVNPLTIVSFAAVAGSLALDGVGASVAFAAGAGLGSGAWHLALPLAAANGRRWLTPTARRRLTIGGRLGVLALAAHLALAAAD
jgi:arginine exporter protein ArgO